MKYIVNRLNNENKKLLVEFEKWIRETESEIWSSEFDEKIYSTTIEKKNFDTSTNVILCAFEENKIIARCDIIIHESLMDFERTGYIDWIYVEKSYRSKGIGEVLINNAIEYLKGVGVTSCYLFTAGNEAAQAFYSKLDSMIVEKKEVASNNF